MLWYESKIAQDVVVLYWLSTIVVGYSVDKIVLIFAKLSVMRPVANLTSLKHF